MANNFKNSKSSSRRTYQTSSRKSPSKQRSSAFNNIRNFEEEVAEEIIINKGKVDPSITISMVMLITLGTIMIFSASYYFAQTRLKTPDVAYFFKRQGAFALIGFAILPFITKLDWRVFRRFSFFIFFSSIS